MMKSIGLPALAVSTLLCAIAADVLLVGVHSPETTMPRSGVSIVDGVPPPERRLAETVGTATPRVADERRDDADIAAAIERSYPIVRDVAIRCDAASCEVSITPKPSSSADEDRIADTLLDGGLDRILGAYGYHATAPVVVDVLGGVNIGFRQAVARR